MLHRETTGNGNGMIVRPSLTQLNLDANVLQRFVHVVDQGQLTILGGSIVEGIGNALSDLDLYSIVGQRLSYGDVRNSNHAFVQRRDNQICANDDDPVFLTMDYYPGTAMHLEVEYWTWDELRGIVSRIEEEYVRLLNHADNNYSEGGLSRTAKLLVHRIYVGIQLSPCVDTRIISDEVATKYRYGLYRALANGYWSFQDAVGAARVNQWDMSQDVMRSMIKREAHALAILFGCTNPTSKWIFSHLRTFVRPHARSLADRLADLLSMRVRARGEKYVLECCRALEHIESVARDRIKHEPGFVQAGRMLDLIREERLARQTTNCPIQEHELSFRARSYLESGDSYVDLFRNAPAC